LPKEETFIASIVSLVSLSLDSSRLTLTEFPILTLSKIDFFLGYYT